MEWLQARYAEGPPEPLAEESRKSAEFIELREEMMKNKKRSKAIRSMLKAQSKLLRSLALSINPNFQLPEGIERVSGTADGTNDINGGHQASLAVVEELNEESTDENASDSLFEDDL